MKREIENNEYYDLAQECKEIINRDRVRIDRARISKPLEKGKMFFIIGFKRNTKDDEGQWTDENGKHIDFDYVHEQVIASGYNKEELIKSIEEYYKLLETTWEEYFENIAANSKIETNIL